MHRCMRVRPFGDPGIVGRVPLPRDYRSLPRPSSAPCAKASAVRPAYLGPARAGRLAYFNPLSFIGYRIPLPRARGPRGDLML